MRALSRPSCNSIVIIKWHQATEKVAKKVNAEVQPVSKAELRVEHCHRDPGRNGESYILGGGGGGGGDAGKKVFTGDTAKEEENNS